ncbi:MAG: hypothetical protein MZU97_11240 [Bacillus subtilis]|nr:hypothetical protein [Bacillus subtilis]
MPETVRLIGRRRLSRRDARDLRACAIPTRRSCERDFLRRNPRPRSRTGT